MDTDHAGTHAPDPEEAMDSSMAETGRDHERDKDDAQSLLKAITGDGDGPASSSPPPAPTPAEVANALKARAAELATTSTSTSTSTEKPKEDQKVVGFCFTCFNGFPGGRAFLMSLEIGVPILVVAGIVALIVCCTTSSSEGDDITESSSRSRSKNRAGHGTEEDNFNYAMSGQPGQQSIWRAGVRGAPQQQLQRSYSGGGRGRAGQKGAGSRAAADQWNAQFQQAAKYKAEELLMNIIAELAEGDASALDAEQPGPGLGGGGDANFVEVQEDWRRGPGHGRNNRPPVLTGIVAASTSDASSAVPRPNSPEGPSTGVPSSSTDSETDSSPTPTSPPLPGPPDPVPCVYSTGERWDEVTKCPPCGVNKTGQHKRYLDSGDEKNCKHDLVTFDCTIVKGTPPCDCELSSTEYEYVEDDPNVPQCPDCGDPATAIGYKRQKVLQREDPGGKCAPERKIFLCASEKNMQRCKDPNEGACKLSATEFDYPQRCPLCGVNATRKRRKKVLDHGDGTRPCDNPLEPFDCATSPEFKTPPCDCKLRNEGDGKDWEVLTPCPSCGWNSTAKKILMKVVLQDEDPGGKCIRPGRTKPCRNLPPCDCELWEPDEDGSGGLLFETVKKCPPCGPKSVTGTWRKWVKKDAEPGGACENPERPLTCSHLQPCAEPSKNDTRKNTTPTDVQGVCLRCGEDKLSGGKNCLLALEIGLGAVVLILVALLVYFTCGSCCSADGGSVPLDYRQDGPQTPARQQMQGGQLLPGEHNNVVTGGGHGAQYAQAQYNYNHNQQVQFQVQDIVPGGPAEPRNALAAGRARSESPRGTERSRGTAGADQWRSEPEPSHGHGARSGIGFGAFIKQFGQVPPPPAALRPPAAQSKLVSVPRPPAPAMPGTVEAIIQDSVREFCHEERYLYRPWCLLIEVAPRTMETNLFGVTCCDYAFGTHRSCTPQTLGRYQQQGVHSTTRQQAPLFIVHDIHADIEFGLDRIFPNFDLVPPEVGNILQENPQLPGIDIRRTFFGGRQFLSNAISPPTVSLQEPRQGRVRRTHSCDEIASFTSAKACATWLVDCRRLNGCWDARVVDLTTNDMQIYDFHRVDHCVSPLEFRNRTKERAVELLELIEATRDVTEFFQILRRQPWYKSLPESAVILVPCPPDSKPALKIAPAVLDAHVLQPRRCSSAHASSTHYLNLLGAPVRITVDASAGTRTVQLEPGLDRPTRQIVVIDGSLIEDGTRVKSSSWGADGAPNDAGGPEKAQDADADSPSTQTHGPKVAEDDSNEALLRHLSEHPDYLVLFPELEQRLFREIESLQCSVVQVPGQEPLFLDRVEALVSDVAREVYKQVSQAEYTDRSSTRGGGRGAGAGNRTGLEHHDDDKLLYSAKPLQTLDVQMDVDMPPRAEMDDPQLQAESTPGPALLKCYLNPEYLCRGESKHREAFDLDHVHDSIARSVYAVLAPFLLQWFAATTKARDAKIRKACTQKSVADLLKQNDFAAALCAKLAKTGTWRGTRTSVVVQATGRAQGHDEQEVATEIDRGVVDFLARGLGLRLGRRLAELFADGIALRPRDKLLVFLELVQKWIPAVVNGRRSDSGTGGEADDLIAIVIIVLFCGRIPALAAHVMGCEMYLERARTLPREYEYAFSLIQSAVLFLTEL
eukprot:g3458.t1